MSDLYNRIEELCKQRGITGYRMCTDLGLSRSFMTGLRKGVTKSATIETAKKIADYFEISVDDLFVRNYPSNEETFDKRTGKRVIANQQDESAQKKEAAPIMEQLPEDRRELIEEIMNLDDDQFQMAKDLLDVMLRKRGGGTP